MYFVLVVFVHHLKHALPNFGLFELAQTWMDSILNEVFNTVLLTCVIAFWCNLCLLQNFEYFVLNISVKYSTESSENQRLLSLTRHFKGIVSQSCQQSNLYFILRVSLKTLGYQFFYLTLAA